MKSRDNTDLYDFYGKCPSPGELIPLSLQHVLAAVVGVITPSIIVAESCGLSDAESTMMIQAALLTTAVAILLQLFPVFRRIGSGLPVIMGTSFTYVPTMQAIGMEFGLPAILGAQIIGGMLAIFFGIFVKHIRKLFPDVVTGTVIFSIGLSLYPTAVSYMAGGIGSADFGGLKNWVVALFTFSVVFILNQFGKGILKLGSMLFGMIAGYLAALCLGMVDFTALSQVTGLISLPRFHHFEIRFVPAACVSLAVVYIVNSVETIGALTSTTMEGLDREPTDRELSGGIIAQGVVSMLSAFIGGLPTGSFNQNVGIVSVTRVVNRFVFLAAALILMAAGLVPKFSALLTTIPQSVIGGATISVFAVIAMSGVRLIIKDDFEPRESVIAGISVALGAGVTQVPGSLSGPFMPAWVSTVFGSSSVVIAALSAIILNMLVPRQPGNGTQA